MNRARVVAACGHQLTLILLATPEPLHPPWMLHALYTYYYTGDKCAFEFAGRFCVRCRVNLCSPHYTQLPPISQFHIQKMQKNVKTFSRSGYNRPSLYLSIYLIYSINHKYLQIN